MSTRHALLRLLADGAIHSGPDLAARLTLSRAAVCKAAAALTRAGVEIERARGRGYRLPVAVETLDRRRIGKFLGTKAAALRDRLTVLDEVDSTSRFVLDQAASPAFHGSVCLTEAQPRGRGRRGRAWVATPYHNLMLSMGWRFDVAPMALSGLPLVAGVAVVRALESYGVRNAGLKWPNDILWQGRKLAGLLLDLRGEASGPSHVVLGVGINGYLAPRDAAQIEQPWVDLHTITGGTVARNRLAALVIDELRKALTRFAREGFSPFRAEWQRRHLHQGQKVRLMQDGETHEGIASGVDEHGALLLREGAGRTRAFHSGDVSLRT